MYDLNSLLDTASPIAGSVKLEEAVGINSHGWIAANGTRDGRQNAYLLRGARGDRMNANDEREPTGTEGVLSNVAAKAVQ